MKRTINLDLKGEDHIRLIKLTTDPTIDPVVQRVLTLLFFSAEDYVKTREGLTVVDTLNICNTGDLQAVASLFSDVCSYIKNAINESSPTKLLDDLYITLDTDGYGEVQATINVNKADGTTETQLV